MPYKLTSRSSDATLQLLAQALEKVEGTSVWITLFLGGSVVSGEVTKTAQYLSELADKDLIADFDAKIVQEPDLTHLHLRNVSVLSAGKPVPFAGGQLRVRISEIDGWALGRIGAGDE